MGKAKDRAIQSKPVFLSGHTMCDFTQKLYSPVGIRVPGVQCRRTSRKKVPARPGGPVCYGASAALPLGKAVIENVKNAEMQTN